MMSLMANARLRFVLGAAALTIGTTLAGMASRTLNGTGAGLIAVGAALLISAAVAAIDRVDDMTKIRQEVDETVYTVRRIEKALEHEGKP